MDEATFAANGYDYLDNHLLSVVDAIETRSPVRLAAIGIGHDVSRFYRNATRIARIDDLGPALSRQADGPVVAINDSDTTAETVRLDVWLDVACLFKTRSAAQKACTSGKIDVNGQGCETASATARRRRDRDRPPIRPQAAASS